MTSVRLFAQQPKLFIGLEYDYYPAGHIIALQAELSPKNNYHSINSRIGTNLAYRQDMSGLNDHEEGMGFGGSLGYRYYFTPNKHGFFLGTRADLWKFKIDWTDSSEHIKSGTSKITVVQPTFEIGYQLILPKDFEVGVSVANGVEINVKTEGKEVGQGWITLGQIKLTKTLLLNRKN
jgi:hypothetical protein